LGIGFVGTGVLVIVAGACCALANFPKKLAPVAGLSAALIFVGTTGFFSTAVLTGCFAGCLATKLAAAAAAAVLVAGVLVVTGLSAFNLILTLCLLSSSYGLDPVSFSKATY